VQKLESRRLLKALEVVDRALGAQDYLLPSGFSAVDTAVGYSIHLAAELVDFAQFDTLVAYYARLRARPAFQRSLERSPLAGSA
jgi:glutathione S-transferase